MREELMQIDYDHSIGKPTKPDEVDDLLWGRMKIMGLDVDAIGREFREVLKTSKGILITRLRQLQMLGRT
jgi:hypothetical protein